MNGLPFPSETKEHRNALDEFLYFDCAYWDRLTTVTQPSGEMIEFYLRVHTLDPEQASNRAENYISRVLTRLVDSFTTTKQPAHGGVATT